MDPNEHNPPAVPGIDRDILLERIGEDPELYWEILSDLSASYRAVPTQIRVALAEDPDQARRLAHTLKGVLGNLAARELYPVSRALDEAIRNGDRDSCFGLVARLERDLPILCDAIDTARAGAAAPARGGPGDPRLSPQWERLRAALATRRAREAKSIMEEIVQSGLAAGAGAMAEELHTLVRAYRFEDALALLDRHRND